MRSTARFLLAIGMAAAAPSVASAERPQTLMHPMELEHPLPPTLIPHTLFLNNCRPSGCKVTQGSTDSRTDHSDIIMVGQGTLPPFPSNVSWSQVVQCVTQVMAPFNITVTDVDPGTADHFEVMIGGDPSNLGFPSTVGGIADYPCPSPGSCSGTYIPNALVFDFANVWQGDITAICGTAAQEIAHAWTLDHATPSSDPMTYNQYTTPLHYRDGAPCGSDCLYSCPGGGGSCNAFGVQCSGSGMSGTHTCLGSGQSTQNEVQTITALFGPAGAAAPTVKITAPSNGATEQSGTAFPVTITCDTGDGIAEIDLAIDGMPIASLSTSPANFTAPASLTDGTHTITAGCGTKKLASATATAQVIVGHKCSQDSDCQTNYICYQSACIAGPMAMGGLGASCTNNSSCASGACASDGTNMNCVVPCDPNNDQCPNGFGCLMAGTGGVCWAGVAKGGGGGCCDSSGAGAPGSILLSLWLGALLITRRRR